MTQFKPLVCALALALSTLVACNDDPLASKPNPDKADKTTDVVPKTFVSELAEYSTKSDGTFMSSHNASSVELMTWSEANALTPPNGYYIPGRSDWERVLPRQINVGADAERTQHSIFSVGGKLYTANEEIRSHEGEKVVYALRFLPTSTARPGTAIVSDNKWRAAFRYSIYEVAPNDVRLNIEAVYLGEEFDGGVADIVKDDFWKKNSARIEHATLELAGMQTLSESTSAYGDRTMLGKAAAFWTCDTISTPDKNHWRAPDRAYYAGVFAKQIFVHSKQHNIDVSLIDPGFNYLITSKFALRLFRKQSEKKTDN